MDGNLKRKYKSGAEKARYKNKKILSMQAEKCLKITDLMSRQVLVNEAGKTSNVSLQ